jgi:hypothetical protein
MSEWAETKTAESKATMLVRCNIKCIGEQPWYAAEPNKSNFAALSVQQHVPTHPRCKHRQENAQGRALLDELEQGRSGE